MFLCKILAVVDGDTISVSPSPELIAWAGRPLPVKQKIRVFGVDAPELKQAEHGKITKAYTADVINRHSSCILLPCSIDIYNRIVAEVVLEDLNLGLNLLQEGRAIAYRAYLGPKGDRRTRYLEAEHQAKTKGVGVWADPEFVPPAVWRKRKTTGFY
jgi:endonuclease YncB( thermonuclease family)